MILDLHNYITIVRFSLLIAFVDKFLYKMGCLQVKPCKNPLEDGSTSSRVRGVGKKGQYYRKKVTQKHDNELDQWELSISRRVWRSECRRKKISHPLPPLKKKKHIRALRIHLGGFKKLAVFKHVTPHVIYTSECVVSSEQLWWFIFSFWT